MEAAVTRDVASATLQNREGQSIGRFKTPMALLEWTEDLTSVRSAWSPDLP